MSDATKGFILLGVIAFAAILFAILGGTGDGVANTPGGGTVSGICEEQWDANKHNGSFDATSSLERKRYITNCKDSYEFVAEVGK